MNFHVRVGGKSPLIICDDADLEQATSASHIGLFLNHGQCCCASSRIFVDEKIHDAFVAKCIEKAKAIKLGTSEGMDQVRYEFVIH